MKILITTGIYPPDIGGPEQYAKNLAEAFQQLGHEVAVKTYKSEKKLPTGIRHLYFFLKILPAIWRADFILALDTFSVGLPTVAAGRLWRKKVIIRTGGDFLWEGYVERTGDLVLLRKFYQTNLSKLSLKEKIIFRLTRWTLHHATKLVFSTDWQRQIWRNPYGLDLSRTAIVENYYGPKEASQEPTRKNFIFASRPLKLKNLETLNRAFTEVKKLQPDIILESVSLSHAELMNKIASAYAVILPSISEVSPNLVLEALVYDKPVIMTRECGLASLLRSRTLLVDPLSVDDLKAAIWQMIDGQDYLKLQQKVKEFSHLHNWPSIASELLQGFSG